MTTRNDEQRVLILAAGPNGAGKTTLVSRQELSLPVVNADTIMLESGCSPIQAGREALAELHGRIQSGISSIYETTLSGRGVFRLLELARKYGFFLALHYVGLDNADLAVERVKTRFASDQGHDVPETEVRRRYERSLQNLPTCIRECDLVVLYDNSCADHPYREIFRKERLKEPIVQNVGIMPEWAQRAIAEWRKAER